MSETPETKTTKNESPTTPSDVATNTETMKCALATAFAEKFGEVDDIITISTSHPKPKLDSDKKQMLLKVLACSISAGDTLVMGGKMIFLRPELPYIPGMDVCGVVEAVTDKVTEFKVGDTVVANNGMLPVGGMAEYMIVESANAALKPPSVDIIQAASCSSAVTALHAVSYAKEGQRVLILGGSGGVGTATISLAKNSAGASFVATTSSQTDLCKSLGADEVINYKEKNWWEIEEYKTNKFDVIIDTVGGGNFQGKAEHVLKSKSEGGYFIAVTGDDPRPDLSSWFNVLKYFANLPVRPVLTYIRKSMYPQFVYLLPYDMTNGMVQVLQLMEDGILKIALDPSSPHDFSEEGVKAAFRIQGSGHAHGKVVVKIDPQK